MMLLLLWFCARCANVQNCFLLFLFPQRKNQGRRFCAKSQAQKKWLCTLAHLHTLHKTFCMSKTPIKSLHKCASLNLVCADFCTELEVLSWQS